MASYCMEFSKNSARVIVHEKCCGSYDLANLLTEGMVSDIGTHNNALSALNAVSEKFQDAELCYACCPVIKAKKVILKSTNQVPPIFRLPKTSKDCPQPRLACMSAPGVLTGSMKMTIR